MVNFWFIVRKVTFVMTTPFRLSILKKQQQSSSNTILFREINLLKNKTYWIQNKITFYILTMSYYQFMYPWFLSNVTAPFPLR